MSGKIGTRRVSLFFVAVIGIAPHDDFLARANQYLLP